MIATANTLILSGWCMPMSQHVKRICRAVLSCAIIAPSHASGPVRKNTFSEAAATLAVKQGFVTSESQAGAGASGDCHAGFGRGGPTREDGRTTSDVFLTPRPPDARKNADGGFVHVPEGIDMTRTTSTKGATARTTTPKTTREPVAGLSFFYEVKGPRGRYTGEYSLAFPDEKFIAGMRTGYRAAGELLACLEQLGRIPPSDVHTLFRLALEQPAMQNELDDRGARFALRSVLYQALKFFARNAKYGEWLSHEIAEAEYAERKDAERERQRIQRSIEARRAKQAAKAEGGADA